MHTKDHKDKLEKKVRVLSETIWKDKIESGQLQPWLDNFRNLDKDVEERERINMLYLLSNFMYFGNKETREMLKCIYRDKFQYTVYQQLKKKYNEVKIDDLHTKFKSELSKTKFLGVGNPSESGVHLLYYFRQENSLSKDNFINTFDIFKLDQSTNAVTGLADDSITKYVFIDDFCGSGDQAVSYSKDVVEIIKHFDKQIEVFYFPLFATKDSVNRIKRETAFDKIDPVFILDSSFKCFADDTRYFGEKSLQPFVDRSFAEETAKSYGSKLFYPSLGHGDCQLLIGFFHNTPDNTLPIFWSERNGWKAFFKRYHKK
jgi:hypothetical protein